MLTGHIQYGSITLSQHREDCNKINKIYVTIYSLHLIYDAMIQHEKHLREINMIWGDFSSILWQACDAFFIDVEIKHKIATLNKCTSHKSLLLHLMSSYIIKHSPNTNMSDEHLE